MLDPSLTLWDEGELMNHPHLIVVVKVYIGVITAKTRKPTPTPNITSMVGSIKVVMAFIASSESFSKYLETLKRVSSRCPVCSPTKVIWTRMGGKIYICFIAV